MLALCLTLNKAYFYFSYIYGGQMYVDRFDVACDLLHGANKYRLDDLANKCRPFLWSHIYPANVWTALEFFAKEKEQQLYDAALQVRIKKPLHTVQE
jgi:hypothetical protein